MAVGSSGGLIARSSVLSLVLLVLVVVVTARARYVSRVNSLVTITRNKTRQTLIHTKRSAVPVPAADDAQAGGGNDSTTKLGPPFTAQEMKVAEKLLLELKPGGVGAAAAAGGKDPLELAGEHEGDIVRGNNTNGTSGGGSPASVGPKNAILNEDAGKWPNAVIPYVISAEFSAKERETIAAALLRFQQKTCLKITPRASEPDFIYIHRGTGCSCQPGKVGGEQKLSLGEGCLTLGPGNAMHELMHAAGFFHEQARIDRDDYVDVMWDNLQPGTKVNFDKQESNTLGFPYDYDSIMHYTNTSFSVDGTKLTIMPKVKGVNIGQRTDLSQLDIAKLNKFYNCPPTNNGSTDEGQGDGDSFTLCSIWAEKGECGKKADFMQKRCHKSCGAGGGKQTAATTAAAAGQRDDPSLWEKSGGSRIGTSDDEEEEEEEDGEGTEGINRIGYEKFQPFDNPPKSPVHI